MIPILMIALLLSMLRPVRKRITILVFVTLLLEGIGVAWLIVLTLKGDPALMVGFLLSVIHLEIIPFRARTALTLLLLLAYVIILIKAQSMGFELDCGGANATTNMTFSALNSTDSSTSNSNCALKYLQDLAFLFTFFLFEGTSVAMSEVGLWYTGWVDADVCVSASPASCVAIAALVNHSYPRCPVFFSTAPAAVTSYVFPVVSLTRPLLPSF